MAMDLVFMFCAPGPVLGGTVGVGSRLHVLRSRTIFGCYRGRCVPFLCFALPDSFSTVPRALALDFMFCPPRHVSGGTEGTGSRFHVLRSRTRFGRYRGRCVPFSCFVLPDSFSTVPRASALVFMFCAPGILLGVTEGVRARFQVLRSQTRFWRYRGRRVPFSCFSVSDSFWALPRASGPVFMFCAPGHVFGATEGVGSRCHVLRSPTRFWRYRGRRVPFSCFALPDTFWAVPRASGLVFMFCALGIILGDNEVVGSRFHVLRFRTLLGRRVPF
jgi:hypothetical protein